MTRKSVIVLVWALLCSCSSFAQVSEVSSNDVNSDSTVSEPVAPAMREELKQYVSKMTFESGDRRILQLPTRVKTVKIQSRNQFDEAKSAAPMIVRKRHEGPKQVSVQCNPLGEADAIGVIPESYEKPKGRRDTIDVYASEDVDLSLDRWRRLATLACLEDEI